MTYLWVAVGGAIGSVARYWIALVITALTGPSFPWGTILINVVGSFIIAFFGTLTGVAGSVNVPNDARVFVMVGVCGGFTTFSSFSLQTLDLAREGRPLLALANIVGSVLLCLIAVTIGYAAAAAINAAKGSG